MNYLFITLLDKLPFLLKYSVTLKAFGRTPKDYRMIRKACSRVEALLDHWETLKAAGRLLGIDSSVPFDAHPVAVGRRLSVEQALSLKMDLLGFKTEVTAFIRDAAKAMDSFRRIMDALSEGPGVLRSSGSDILELPDQLSRATKEASAAVAIVSVCMTTLVDPFRPGVLDDCESKLERALEKAKPGSAGGELRRQRLTELLAYVRAVAPGAQAAKPVNGTAADVADFGRL